MAKRKTKRPTLARVLALFRYDPKSGNFIWIVGGRGIRIGSIAGAPNGRGYLRLVIDGERYLAHLVAWLVMTGKWPRHGVDHQDSDGANNRWGNLRRASQAENMANKRTSSLNKCGFKGVCLDKRRGLYKAEIQKGAMKKFLGYFITPELAHAAYAAEAVKVHGEFARAA